jgi:hypothetical protein
MFYDILFIILLLSWVVRSVFKTVAVIKGVFKSEKKNS